MNAIHRFHIPARTGYAFRVMRAQIVRISQPEGSQVADFNALNATNPRETFSSSITRQLEGTHLTTGARLWSAPPWEEPLLTITADSVPRIHSARGATSHDLLFGRCTRKYRVNRYGEDTPGCHENLAAALARLGLGEEVVHDPFNIFMKTGLDSTG